MRYLQIPAQWRYAMRPADSPAPPPAPYPVDWNQCHRFGVSPAILGRFSDLPAHIRKRTIRRLTRVAHSSRNRNHWSN